MKKTIILIISAILVLITIIGYKIYENNIRLKNSKEQNKVYESFYNVNVLGTDVASLLNRIEDANSKNSIEKDENEKYIDNNKNSINFEIKFNELDDVISLETIKKQGINQFVQNFGAMNFRCTKIEYHKATGYIKYMYFEQV